jgi:hypothetical protein
MKEPVDFSAGFFFFSQRMWLCQGIENIFDFVFFGSIFVILQRR